MTDLSVPIVLQQLLRSMEDPKAPRSAAITYAVLSLLARLFSAQIGVLSLWNGRRAYERSRGEMITMLYDKTLSRKILGINQDTKASASMGKILNLMRNDVYEVAQRFWEFQSLITSPLGLIFSLVLLWQIIGWPCLIGVLTVIVGQALNALFARFLLKSERRRRTATDKKLQKVSQFVEAIRHLRWYGWQDTWCEQIMVAREHELSLRIITGLWNIMIGFTNSLASGMFPVTAFWAYTALAGQPLRIDIAFPALQVFNIVESNLRDIPEMITVLLNARVAIGRIEDFMREPDVDSHHGNIPKGADRGVRVSVGEENWRVGSPGLLKLEGLSFAWPGQSDTVLRDINISFSQGLNVICGEVGAGKTALLEALLGELDQKSGYPFRFEEAVGYCAQRPWLQSMSIRDNILFSAPYEEERYKNVLEACALTTDMVNFKHGDRSNIGENGIGLSGGQKARVALARAVYSRASILLLDDPISALDHQTADFILNNCLSGELMKDRTIILVTHRTELCHGLAKQVIEVAEGTVRVLDLEKPYYDRTADKSSLSPNATNNVDEANGAPEKFMEDERRQHGGVKTAVYWEYIRAGKLKWWFFLACLLTLYQTASVTQNWFLKQWGEAYTDSSEMRLSRSPFDSLPPPDTNITPWLAGYALIAASKSILFLISQCSMLVIVYTTGRQMFRDVMRRVSKTSFRFYDVSGSSITHLLIRTFVGQYLPRISYDCDICSPSELENHIWKLILGQNR
jgi:ABC-type multidrug transport system fused ATPase/permease subunit